MDTQTNLTEKQSIKEQEDLKRFLFPQSFLSFLSVRLTETLQKLMAIYGLPEEATQAVDDLVYLQILKNANPEEFKPDGRQGLANELDITIHDVTWLVDELDDLETKMRHEKQTELLKGRKELNLETGWGL